jgi:hypothetical protein
MNSRGPKIFEAFSGTRAYPNLLETKGYVVVVVAAFSGTRHNTLYFF